MSEPTTRSDLLLTGPMMPLVERQLAAHFTVHMLGGADDIALLAEIGPRIKAVATRGGRPVDAALMDKLPNLKIVSNFGVGYDTVEVAAAATRGVVVTNTPGVLDDEVADLAVALTLATVRNLPQADRYVRAGQWPARAFAFSPTIRDRSIGILGMGRIGQAIARRLEPFGRPIAYHTRRPQPDLPWRHYTDLVEMARAVDVLIVIIPGGPSTLNIVNAEVLAALGPTGILINVARGSVVDETALIAALQDGTILSAGLDVFANEPNVPQALIDLDNTVLLPHVGSATQVTRDAMGQLVVDNLIAVDEGRAPLTPVAETPWPVA